MRFISIVLFVCFTNQAFADLDGAIEAYNDEQYTLAVTKAKAALEEQLDPQDQLYAQEIVVSSTFFLGGNDAALRDAAKAADQANAAFYGRDAEERLQLLYILADLEAQLGNFDASLGMDVLIARIARLHLDTATDDLMWALRNLAIAFDHEDADLSASLAFSALFEFFAVDFLGRDDPMAQEATAIYANALFRAGEDKRVAHLFFLYSLESWEAFGSRGPDEEDMALRLWTAFNDLQVDDEDAWFAEVENERDALLNREALAAEIGELLEKGELNFSSPFYVEAQNKMEAYIANSHPEDPTTAFFLSLILRAHLVVGDYAGARVYLGALLVYPPEYLAALDVPLVPLAGAFALRGGVEDALFEPLLLKAQEIETLVPSDDPDAPFDIAFALGNIAERQGRLPEALSHFEQAIEHAGAPNVRPNVLAQAINRAAQVAIAVGEYRLSKDLAQQMLAHAQSTNDEDATSAAYTNLSTAALGLGQNEEAVSFARQKLAFENARDPIVPESLRLAQSNLAIQMLNSEGPSSAFFDVMADVLEGPAFDEGEQQVRSALLETLALRLQTTPETVPDHPIFVNASPKQRTDLVTFLAEASYQAGDLEAAIQWVIFGRGLVVAPSQAFYRFKELEGRLALQFEEFSQAVLAFREVTDQRLSDAERYDPNAIAHLPFHIASAVQLSQNVPAERVKGFQNEAFMMAQLAGATKAGQAFNSALAREQTDGDLRDRLRERHKMDDELISVSDAIARAQYDGRPASDLLARQAALLASREVLSNDIAKVAPEFARIVDINPIELHRVSQTLETDEALLLYSTSDLEIPGGAAASHLIALTRDDVKIVPLPPRGELQALADKLRCSAALTDPSCGGNTAQGTRGRFDPSGNTAQAGPVFDTALAHEAYQVFLEPVADMLTDKTGLIVVPDQALATLPIHLLLKSPHDSAQSLAKAHWLIRDHSIEIAPTVASFEILRNGKSKQDTARRAFLGIGDPLIGVQSDGPLNYACEETRPPLTVAALTTPELQRSAGALRASLVADLAALPDTRCELRAIAERFADSTTLLHADATETRIKEMSAAGKLRDISVLNFATHGLIAGEIGVNEAGLVLTPPTVVSAQDDGLLTTAEIADLDLNADFVILSACNTAAGDSRDSEGLSGLATAFFLAGAKSLLVSHWPVYSDASVLLSTGTFEVLAENPDATRAQALRMSMLSILDDPNASPRTLHPSYWAPFMLVGDGG